METKLHTPVMLSESISSLRLAPGKVVVDATAGTGGHSEKILEGILPGGKLITIDRDEESLEVCRGRLKSYAGVCVFAHANFAQLGDILKGQGIKKIDGILFDLGVSSFQLENPQRGFSFQREGPLDMRLDRSSYISAYDLLNNLNEEEISSLLWNFGQERWHSRIARFLVEERERYPISTTSQLAGIVSRSIPGRYRRGHYRIHPATRTFQAVRIAVNRELENLELALNTAAGLLHKQGRICVVSFHSLEDRIVKWWFRRLAAAGEVEIITAKPLTPLPSEAEANPLSRSAKMRVAEKI